MSDRISSIVAPLEAAASTAKDMLLGRHHVTENPEENDAELGRERDRLVADIREERERKAAEEIRKGNLIVSSFGSPVGEDDRSLTADRRGTVLLQDMALIEKLAHFDRERIPERVVHMKGQGAFGYFECTKDMSEYTKAHLFGEAGRRTPIFVRFSIVQAEKGTPDALRDPRGFAIKFYTQDGNYDLVANNLPIFFVRDSMKFPDVIHSQRRHPLTLAKDWDAYWDFLSLTPESVHMMTMVMSDRGVPKNFRQMHGFGANTFKWVNKDNQGVWIKYHILTESGIDNVTEPETNPPPDPDFAHRDLYEHLLAGNEARWKFCVQIMPLEDADKYRYDPFDVTKVWRHRDYPLIEIGKLVLNRNPDNYFSQVEQAAFCPATLVPGIEASPDRILQGRLFSYRDTQRHRLGPNFAQIPINCPMATARRVRNYDRDGLMQMGDNGGSGPMYHPNSKNGPVADHHYEETPVDIKREPEDEEPRRAFGELSNIKYEPRVPEETGEDQALNASGTSSSLDETTQDISNASTSVGESPTASSTKSLPAASAVARRYDYNQVPVEKRADDFEQAALLYELLSPAERNRLARNIASTLKEAREEVQERMVRIFTAVDKEYGSKVKSKMDALKMLKSTTGSRAGVTGVPDPE